MSEYEERPDLEEHELEEEEEDDLLLEESQLSASLTSIDEQMKKLDTQLRRTSLGSLRGLPLEDKTTRKSSLEGSSELVKGRRVSGYGTTDNKVRKPRQAPTLERIQAAIQLIKANSHTPHPSAHSLLWTEDRLVIELGSLYVKFGFSSHPTPQFVLPLYSPTLLPALDYVERVMGFYSPELEGLISELGGEFMLEDKIFHLLSTMFRTYLAQAPSRRRIILLENPYFPTKLKSLFAKVLFQRFQAAALTFLPIQLTALLSTGESSGLVIDVGNLETTVLPICDGCPLYSHIVTSPLAGKGLTQYLKKLLLAYATVRPSVRTGPIPQLTPTPRPISISAEPQETTLTPAMLSLALLEEVKLRFLLVSTTLLTHSISLADPELEERNLATSQATPVVLPFRYQGTCYDLHIPGWVREHAYDYLFDTSADVDSLSPPQAALECLTRLPTDLRAPLISRLLLTGGTSEPLNFAYRFQREFLHLLASHPRYTPLRPLGDKLALLNHRTLFTPAHHAWAGTVVACKMRSVSEQVNSDKFDGHRVPDWSTAPLTAST